MEQAEQAQWTSWQDHLKAAKFDVNEIGMHDNVDDMVACRLYESKHKIDGMLACWRKWETQYVACQRCLRASQEHLPDPLTNHNHPGNLNLGYKHVFGPELYSIIRASIFRSSHSTDGQPLVHRWSAPSCLILTACIFSRRYHCSHNYDSTFPIKKLILAS